jgi:hypothetical protein
MNSPIALATDAPGDEPAAPAARPIQFNAGRPRQRLPEAAAEFVFALEGERSELGTALHALFEQQQELRVQRRDVSMRRELLVGRRGQGGYGLPDDDQRVVDEDLRLARLDRELELLAKRHAAKSHALKVAAGLLGGIDSWLADTVGRTIVPHSGPVPQLRKSETFAQAIEARRRRVRELQSDLQKFEAAPRPSAVAKELIRKEVDRHAEIGKPQVESVVDNGEPILWPITGVSRASHGVLKMPFTHTDNPFDGLAVLCWLHRDAIIEKLQADVDAVADDAIALTDADRARLIADAKADMLANERDEEVLVRQALAENLNVERRPDCDPRAVLQVEFAS